MDKIILWSVWILTAILLLVFIKRDNFINAQLSFMFMQIPCWLFGTLVAEGKLIEYPIGFLNNVYKASFTFEFFVFPSISAIFNVYFPTHKSWFIKTVYTLSFPAAMTIVEVLLEKNTDIITYIRWSWYWSFITILITLLISYWYYLWFFRKIRAISKASS
ncbi:CBO0543 family protein [Paenibacillus terricola]|uniref:CBO0543 family protein n=1 Tax=Paenibacillus terricola TaxID=2763503 RepID=UPI0037C84030